jgi:EpsG family
MTPYFVIYGLVVAGIFICFFGDTRLRRVAQFLYFIVILFVLAMFAGMRSPNVDRDFNDYATWFGLIQSGDAPLFAWIRDPAFAVFSFIAAKLGLAYPAVAFVYALLGLLATWRFAAAVSSGRWVTLFFYLLFCQYFIVLEMTEIRAAVAIPLMALSLYLASQGLRGQAIGTYVLAMIFHFSVIIALPFLVLVLAGARFRTRGWLVTMIALAAVASVAMRSVIDLLSGLYRVSEYLNGGAEENDLRVISWYALAHLLTIGIPVALLWKRLDLHQRLATLGCSAGLILFIVFGWNTGLATRFLYIFDVYWLLILMIVLESLKGNSRIFYIAFLVLVGFSLYCKSLMYVEPYSVFHEWDARLNPTHLLRGGIGDFRAAEMNDIPIWSEVQR